MFVGIDYFNSLEASQDPMLADAMCSVSPMFQCGCCISTQEVRVFLAARSSKQ